MRLREGSANGTWPVGRVPTLCGGARERVGMEPVCCECGPAVKGNG